jgi:hypothetical protein
VYEYIRIIIHHDSSGFFVILLITDPKIYMERKGINVTKLVHQAEGLREGTMRSDGSRNSSPFIQTEGLLLCSQEPDTGSYP